MKKVQCNWSAIVLLVMCVFFICSCSKDDSDSLSYNPYTPGGPVKAVGYDTTAVIKLYTKDGESYSELKNGDYIGQGPKTLYVEVAGGSFSEGRVFLSDGDVYQVEALLEGEKYKGEFNFFIKPYQPVLVQAIYQNGYASKEKFVLATGDIKPPAADELVSKGFGAMADEDFFSIDNLKKSVGETLSSPPLINVQINSLGSPDNGSGRGANGTLSFNATIDLLIPVTGELIVKDRNADQERCLYVDIEDYNALGNIAQFLGIFPIEKPTIELLDMFGTTGGGDATNDPAKAFINALVAKNLFVDFSGLPSESDQYDVMAMSGGLYLTEESSLGGVAEWTGTSEDWDINKFNPEGTGSNIGLAISQYNLNQVIMGILPDLEITIDKTEFLLAFLDPDMLLDTGTIENSKLVASFNPASIAVDLSDSNSLRLFANDVRLKYIVNSNPMWEMSVDLCIPLFLSLEMDGEDLYLAIDLNVEPEYVYTHVLKDDMGISLSVDHSSFMKRFFGGSVDVLNLLEGFDGSTFRFNLSALLGGNVTFNSENPGSLECSGGYLYMKLNVEDVNLSV